MAEADDGVRLDQARLQEGVDREKYVAAARRLQAYKRRPVVGTELHRMFLAIDLAEGKKASVWDSIKYIFFLLYMSVIGLLSRLDTKKIIKTLTHNSPSIGHRLRLKSSLAAYSTAVKATVGAQTLIRQARQDFCQRNDLNLDTVVRELRLPPPPLAAGHAPAGAADVRFGDDAKGVRSVEDAKDVRFGDDVAEARMAIEQLLVADVISSYIKCVPTSERAQ